MEMVIDLPDDEDDHDGGSFLDPFRPSTLSHSISVAHSESNPYTNHAALYPILENSTGLYHDPSTGQFISVHQK